MTFESRGKEGMDIMETSTDSDPSDETVSEGENPEQLKMTDKEWQELKVDTLIAEHDANGNPEEDFAAGIEAAMAEAEAADPIPDVLADFLEKEKEDPEYCPDEFNDEAKALWREQMKKEIDEMNEDSEEEGYLELTEESLEDFLNKIEQQVFFTEEEAEKWIDEHYHKFVSKRRKHFKHRGKNIFNTQTDLEKLFYDNTRVESTYDGDLQFSEPLREKMWRQVDDSIGRYPHGWRHYESFVNYQVINPHATIQEYIEEMNSQVTFDNFLAIMRQSAIENLEHDPEEANKMQQELAKMEEEDAESEGAPTITPREAINSEFFEQEARALYNEKTQDMLVKGKWFTLVDALNDHLDMIHHGKNMWNFPLHNCYIPVRHTILKKPSMVDGYSDDLGYHYGKTGQNATYDGLDLHPFKPNNPLKGYRMGSPPKERSDWNIHYAQGKPFRKTIHFNRFSKPKTQYGRERVHNRYFSTTTQLCTPLQNVSAVRKYFADWGHQF